MGTACEITRKTLSILRSQRLGYVVAADRFDTPFMTDSRSQLNFASGKHQKTLPFTRPVTFTPKKPQNFPGRIGY